MMAKRLFDIITSALLLVSLSPIFALVALLLKLTDRGPVFYTHDRVGQNLKSFKMHKFRTMSVGSDKLGHSTSSNDARVTGIGRWLRRSSLDELPQLWNVLRGDMSLVGPRPYVPQQEIENDGDYWLERHTVKPGITGLAQVKLRSNATPEQVVKYDLEYVRQYHFWGDIKILVATVGVLFKANVN